MSKKNLIQTFEKAGFVNQHDATEDAVWHGSRNCGKDNAYVTTSDSWQLSINEGQEIIDGNTARELKEQLEKSYPPSRANNPRIRELESQIDKLVIELHDLVEPTPQELEEINSQFSDMTTDQYVENLGTYDICTYVLDQREGD